MVGGTTFRSQVDVKLGNTILRQSVHSSTNEELIYPGAPTRKMYCGCQLVELERGADGVVADG